MADIFKTLVVWADEQAMAQNVAAEYPGGAGMFTTGCSADGQPPATAYISSGMLDEAIVDALVSVPDIVISEADPFVVLAEQGLSLITSTESTDGETDA